MVTPSMPGAPLLAFTRFHALRRLSLFSTACSKSWLIALTSSCFKARCVARAEASRPVGFGDAFELATPLLLVSHCSALHWPDSWPTTMASADFCLVTAHLWACRAAHLDDVCCLFLRHATGSTLRRLGIGIPVEPIRVLSSSSCTARGADLPR